MKLANYRSLISILVFAGVITGFYYANVEYQSYLGRQAVAGTGLNISSLSGAVDEARTRGKLVLVEVSAIWCPTCRRLDREVLADEGVRREIERGFVFTRLEYESEEGQRFLRDKKTDGFPNLWVLDGYGRPVRQLNVTFDPEEFIGQLRSAEFQVSYSLSSVNRKSSAIEGCPWARATSIPFSYAAFA